MERWGVRRGTARSAASWAFGLVLTPMLVLVALRAPSARAASAGCEPGDPVEAVVFYRVPTFSLELGAPGSSALEVVVTSDLAATGSSVRGTGPLRRQTVTVSCSFGVALRYEGSGVSTTPTSPMQADLADRTAATFGWAVAWSTRNDGLRGRFVLDLGGTSGELVIEHTVEVVAPSPTTTTALPPSTVPPTIPPTVTIRPITTAPPASPSTGPPASVPATVRPGPSTSRPSLPLTDAPSDPGSVTTTGGTASSGGASGGPPPDVDECRRERDQLRAARLVYEPTERMTVGQTTVVEAVVTVDLVTPAASLLDNPSQPTAVSIRTGCLVRARLLASPEDFSITPPEARDRVVLEQLDARWNWQVTPRRSGSMPLTLEVVGVAEGSGGEFPAGGREVRKVIEVVSAGPDGLSATVRSAPASTSADADGGLGTLVTAVLAAGVVAGGVAGLVGVRRRSRPRGVGVADATTVWAAGASATPAAGTGPTRLFLSYSRADLAYAEELHRALEAAGHDVWRDSDDIRGGQTWRQSIVAGLEQADVVLFLLSPRSMQPGDDVEIELSIAQDSGIPIVPLQLEPVQVRAAFRYLIARQQLVDITRLEPGAAVGPILQAVAAVAVRRATSEGAARPQPG